MTYFSVLAIFILPPLIVLMIYVPRDIWHWLGVRLLHRSASCQQSQSVLIDNPRPTLDWKPYLAVLVHVWLALIYTTPWDNYLVATRVWWYDSALVAGITVGWVPIEEYTFFILQTLLVGLWALLVHRAVLPIPPKFRTRPGFRLWASILTFVLWIISTILLFSGWRPGTYLTLILSWALLPVLFQVTFGADILLAEGRRLALIILLPTIYLWWVDSIAINSGTWTINPSQTTGIMLGTLPLEEMLFFIMTNLMIGFGVTLMLSPHSLERVHRWRRTFSLGSKGHSEEPFSEVLEQNRITRNKRPPVSELASDSGRGDR